ncbi:hypothetical protein A306_00000138, partial [Columba livia]
MTLTERLRERISRAFYNHGLLCASYPIPIILFTGLCILACCYPLLKLPLPGTGPVEYSTPVKDYSPPSPAAGLQQGDLGERPDWYVGAPVAYIQQIFVKATVSPWQKNFLAVDVFRSPLSRVFQLVEEIRNHALRDSSGVKSLEEVCLQVTDLLPGLKKLRNLLPEHGCLLLSPGNFWQNDRERFNADPDIIKTIHQHEPKTLQTSATLKDLLFGLPGKYSGVNLYNRKRVVSYTVTLGLRQYDSRFLSSLRSRLKLLHPSPNCTLREENIVHVHFKEEIGIAELIPLVTTYIILFAYIYFSTRKIDMVKSKWGLALAAVVTVLSSLLMSVGLCTLFGLTPTLNGGEIFPYLVVVIGLENVLVLTKSVVSTPVDLEEFCLFAVVGLVSDFFLQMFFFTTVLSIDIRRMELADLNRRLPAEACMPPAKPVSRAQRYERQPAMRPATPHTITLQPSSFRNLRLPKRLRVIYFFARTRLAQRLIMAGTVIWIGILVYTDPAGLRTYLTSQVTEQSPLGEAVLPPMPVPGGVLPAGDPKIDLSVFPSDPIQLSENQTQQREQKLGLETNQHSWAQGPEGKGNGQTELGTEAEVTWGAEDEEIWRKLSFRHWPYISILPAIPVTLYLNPQEALEVRHPQEVNRYQPFLSPSRGKLDAEAQPGQTSSKLQRHQDVTLYKVAALGLASGIILVLLLFCLYRVFCPKNYGQNGLSHSRRKRGDLPCDDYGYSPPETEIVPLVLRGHLMDIECLASDGMLLVSCCLVGQIRVLRRDSSGIFDYQESWDHSPDGKNALDDPLENSHQLKRMLSPPQPPLFCDQPDLTSLIDTNFSEQAKVAESETRLRSVAGRQRETGYDFSSLVGKVYEEHGTSNCRSFASLSASHRQAGFCGAEEGGCASRRRSLGDESLMGRPGELGLEPGAAGEPDRGRPEIVAARLNGSLDFFSLETHTSLNHLQFRGAPSRSSIPSSPVVSSGDVVSCQLTHTVFRLEDSCCLFTLQGHSGAITAVYMDQTMVLASGGQDGAICLWDVLTGSKVSHMYAHRGDVTSLTCTASCVISSGLDDVISIWDRSSGIKLYSIQQ